MAVKLPRMLQESLEWQVQDRGMVVLCATEGTDVSTVVSMFVVFSTVFWSADVELDTNLPSVWRCEVAVDEFCPDVLSIRKLDFILRVVREGMRALAQRTQKAVKRYNTAFLYCKN